jgi:hypothetical protein
MSESEILAVPSQLLETAPVYTSKAGSVTTFGSEVDSATQSLLSTLEGSGLPLGSFLEATATLIAKTQVSFECAEKNLESMAHGLATSAQEFSSTDAQLAALFTALEGVIPEFAGYEPASITLPGQSPPEATPHIPPSPHRGFWGTIGHGLAAAWDDTGGKGVSFVGQQAENFGAGLAGLGAGASVLLQLMNQPNPSPAVQELEGLNPELETLNLIEHPGDLEKIWKEIEPPQEKPGGNPIENPIEDPIEGGIPIG